MAAVIEHIATLEGHQDRVWHVVWNPSGTLLASCSGDKTTRIWGREGADWVVKAALEGAHQRTVRSACWSPCGQFLATASFDATIAIWKWSGSEFECITTLEGHENEVKSVSWCTSGALLATCSRDKSVWVWEVDEDQEFECASVLSSHTQDVKCVTWHPHEEMIASCSYDNTIKLYRENGDDWECCATLDSHSSTVWAVDFDKTGTRMVSCSDDRDVKIWQHYPPGNEQGVMTNGREAVWKCVCTLSGHHSRAIYDVKWCKLTGLVATACGDDTIRIFQEDTGSERHAPSFALVATQGTVHTADINSLSWSPSEAGLLASASDDGLISIVRVEANDCIA